MVEIILEASPAKILIKSLSQNTAFLLLLFSPTFVSTKQHVSTTAFPELQKRPAKNRRKNGSRGQKKESPTED